MGNTYDQIFQCFINNCGVDTNRLPQLDEEIYQLINNATMHYNTFISESDSFGKLICNNATETINVILDDDRLLILAYCLKYVYLENQLVGFQELWSPFMKEIGFKDYKAQSDGRQNTLDRTKNKIIELLTNIEDVNIM